VWSSESVTNNPFGNRNVSIGSCIPVNCTPRIFRGTPAGACMTTVLMPLAIIAAVALLFVAATVVAVWWNQERIAYQPPADWPAAPSHTQRIDFIADDGQDLYAHLIMPDAKPHGGILLAFHGNADLAIWQIPWAVEVTRQTGWCVLLAEYRGYGGLPGMPTYVGIQTDARATWQMARRVAREYLGESVPLFALFGHSLGSAVAVELAMEIHAAATESLVAIVLQSPFTSARSMVRIVTTRPVQLLWKLIARVHYDTRARLRLIDTATWVAHGDHDWLVPVSMGRELFASARVHGELLIVRGAGHNDVDQVGGDSYWRWFSNALMARDRRPTLQESGSIIRTETPGSIDPLSAS
jgi:uncharacterized protein